jgi:hypothetical protein
MLTSVWGYKRIGRRAGVIDLNFVQDLTAT